MIINCVFQTHLNKIYPDQSTIFIHQRHQKLTQGKVPRQRMQGEIEEESCQGCHRYLAQAAV